MGVCMNVKARGQHQISLELFQPYFLGQNLLPNLELTNLTSDWTMGSRDQPVSLVLGLQMSIITAGFLHGTWRSELSHLHLLRLRSQTQVTNPFFFFLSSNNYLFKFLHNLVELKILSCTGVLFWNGLWCTECPLMYDITILLKEWLKHIAVVGSSHLFFEGFV